MSRGRVLWAAGAIVALGAGAWVVLGGRREEAPKYRTATLERGSIEAVVSATGTIRPVEQVDVGSQVSGTVYRLHADYNSRVRAGQVLCELEPSSFRARAAQSEAAVARAEAAVRESRRQLDRARELLPQNYVSQADVDAAESALQQREADLKQARAQLEAARVDLQNATIRSPIDGVVIARSVNLGQTVAASLQAPKLFVIANDLAQMQVETRIDEADIGQIRPGLPVRFTVDAFPDRTFEGSVTQVRLEPIVEQNVVTYTTVIRTDNRDLQLRPGMTANVSVEVARREDVLRVPNSALRFRPGGEATRAAAGGNAAGGGGRGAARAAGGAPGGAGPGARGPRTAPPGAGASRAPGAGADAPAAPGMKPGAVYVLREGKPARVEILTGLTDGGFTEAGGAALRAGDRVIVGLDVSIRGAALQPPPGMGGPQFGGGGGRPQGGGGGRPR